jgi:glycosyltransferase involved in cell wall biosynthesis
MKKKYDFVYLTNTPSFYKIALCDRIAQTHRLLLVLYGYGSEAVNTELGRGGKLRFDYVFIHEGDSNARNKFKTLVNLLRLMRRIEYTKVLYCGWLAPEYNFFSFLCPKAKNVAVCESSKYDVSFAGVAGMVKRLIIGRMGAVLPSGKPHREIFESIGFKGTLHITGSVGIFHKVPDRALSAQPHQPLRYLYVGRLVDVKNVSLLIEEFNRNGKPLTIVGKGELESKLKAMAKPNITFMGFVENESLGDVYKSHDVFVLASHREPWGLVVEEALYWGLPVIVSDRVGSSIDMVQDLGTGEIFKSGSVDSLHSAIEKVEEHYHFYRAHVLKIDWEQRDAEQVKAYTDLIPQ